MKRLFSTLTILSLLLPSFSFATINTDKEILNDLQVIDTSAVQIEDEASTHQLAEKLSKRLAKNMQRLNRKYSRMSNRRANRIWNRVEEQINYESVEELDQFAIDKSSKEKLVELTNAENTKKYQEQIYAAVETECEEFDGARTCLNKIRENHRNVAGLTTKTEDGRKPASIRTFLCKAGQVAIGLLWIAAGVFLAPFTVGYAAPLMFIGLMWAIIMPDKQC